MLVHWATAELVWSLIKGFVWSDIIEISVSTRPKAGVSVRVSYSLPAGQLEVSCSDGCTQHLRAHRGLLGGGDRGMSMSMATYGKEQG